MFRGFLVDFSTGLIIQYTYVNYGVENTYIEWVFPISLERLLYASYQLGKNNSDTMNTYYNQTTYIDVFKGTYLHTFSKNNQNILQRLYGFLLAIGY